MKFVDIFAGLGGFHLAASRVGGKCVFASELNTELRELYESNFGMKAEGDIRKIDVKAIPGHDLLCAGFPCQPFSKAGSQEGWLDTERGNIFDCVTDILREHRPEFVMLENVAHFANHDGGGSYRRVKNSLQELDYEVKERKLSPHQFGVPHFRERLFVVGRRGGLEGFEFPEPVSGGPAPSIGDVLDPGPFDALKLSEQVLRCLEVWQEFLAAIPPFAKLPSFPIWAMEFDATYPYDRDALRDVRLSRLRSTSGSFGIPLKGRSREEISKLVPSYARAEQGAFPRWKKDFIRQNRQFLSEHRDRIVHLIPTISEFPPSLQKFEWNCQGEVRDLWRYLIQFRASGVRVKRFTTAPSLVAMTTTQVPIIGPQRRYMTVRECARLQSMDGIKHLPTGERAVAALGNAVNVKVVKLILERLLDLSPKRVARKPEEKLSIQPGRLSKV